MHHYTMLINGVQVAGENGQFDVINPATGTAFAQCPAGSLAQLDQAVAAAQAAFKTWRHSTHALRCERLLAIAEAIEQDADALARLIVLEQGKPLELALSEVMGAAAWTRYAAAQQIPVELVEETPTQRVELHRKPLGVVASITPWNWPVMIAVWHIMPALRAGNCVISKPSSLTPLSTLRLVDIIARHLPHGVINCVTGEQGFGSAITSHPGIQKIVFTGSTATGQSVMRGAAGNLKRLTLELGGNDAAIVLPGTPVEEVAEAIFQAAFLNMGQTCAALKRLYVHESQYSAFADALTRIAARQVVGDGLAPGVTFGPVQNLEQLQLVEALVADAREHGARVLCGGARLERPGFFYPPTLVADVTDGQRLVDEEQFGPVLPLIAYQDVEDVLRRANAGDMGLGGSVWGPDVEQATALASRLESGVAWVNCHARIQPNTPFGGSKMSGFGVEFGLEGLLEFTGQQLLFVHNRDAE
ncbi:aldehyde dehydrogenase family protein [Pseudomonas veronii]|jgi:acyl-CoA reductase-like NAD-dependent aldehyde dehydrogenase|uniref:aldehyde dehydrogenase family protein n=1 Tax=Pseudomonas TaxID=286 RepID=UPI00061DC2CD|nr:MULTISPECIES: aldehyde dehydrogenase family protein [Pseudomonas]MCT8964121.1 aldehyde dehydrogenase family protein [Pseudomonas veronii]MCT9823480.1 aldehyde dehydrogenase family protein [Pseudomonas veronii]NMX38229.1 aldehyde dehydrogenase family protein [Pseudomonas veronii]NWC58099.1 aldehyde dehydrogenase family protein [Pseudomonas veronii]PUB29312.1 acyl-CoA reductase-like NAD-dependent aldehyde dehydrogenase [Pseudomonas sp. GV105]